MKFFRTLMMLASLSVALSAGNVVLTTDPLTGLPIDPKSDPGMNVGNAPSKNGGSCRCATARCKPTSTAFLTRWTLPWPGTPLISRDSIRPTPTSTIVRKTSSTTTQARCWCRVQGENGTDGAERRYLFGDVLPLSTRPSREGHRFLWATRNSSAGRSIQKFTTSKRKERTYVAKIAGYCPFWQHCMAACCVSTPAVAAADAACQPIFDAATKIFAVPTHSYTAETLPGGKSRNAEAIYANNAIYVL